MDIEETAEQREVRERYTAWLTDFLPDDYHDRYLAYRWDIPLRRDHQRAAFEAGWLMPAWPRDLGGQELDTLETLTVRLTAAQLAAPKLPNIQGPGVVAPAIRAHGTPEQVERYLVPVLRGDEWWALGMSEPEAGSDFGSLRTRGVERDGVFVVNGQKIWTSHAHQSRFATLYVRTDPDAPKHRGISCLILDLEAPGVTVRPIRMANPTHDQFCEVFLDDVEIPVENLLGARNDGWRVAMSALTDERDMIWIMNWVDIERGIDRVRRSLAAVSGDGEAGTPEDLLVDLGRRAADGAALRFMGYRAVTADLRGESAPVGLALKLFGSEALQRTWDLAIDAAGPEAVTDLDDLVYEDFEGLGATIYGGTSEVQRNIVGERVLGLPKS